MPASGALEIYETPEALAQALAGAIADKGDAAISERGAFFVSLAGGSTPKAAYRLLAKEPLRSRLSWKATNVYFGDERCVPPDHPESNYAMARETLLDAVPIASSNVHRMRGEDDPPSAARDYAKTIVHTMGDRPRFDLVLLGMGPDGHTASLFPGTDPTIDDDRLVRAVYVEKLASHRLTLTPRIFNNARSVIVAAEGLPKAPALYAVREGPYDPVIHPVQIVAPRDGTLTWMVDRAAAAELRENRA